MDRVFGLVFAVLKIYDSVYGFEKFIVVGLIGGYILVFLFFVKQFEEGLKFLFDNCGLVVEWMEDIVKFLDENVVDDDKYILNLMRLLRIFKEIKILEICVWFKEGFLSYSFDKFEFELRKLVKENCIFSLFLEVVIQKLYVIIERLKVKNRFENCKIIYVDVRSSSVREVL